MTGSIARLLLAIEVASGVGLAATLPLQQFGPVINPVNAKVIWRVPTNDIPESLWVYRVLPATFSPTVISNFLELGSLTERDRRQVPNYPTIRSYCGGKETRTLWVNPQRAYIEYRDSEADDINVSVGVPRDDQNVLSLGTNLLSKFGVDLSQLARKTNGMDLDVGYTEATAILYKDVNSPSHATNTHMRGVMFIRAIDGVPFIGRGVRGGCTIEFGHDAKVSRVILAWRNLERDKLYPVVKRDTLARWLIDGKAVWVNVSETPVMEWPSIKQITINKAKPYYFGEPYMDAQQQVFPFLVLDVIVEADGRNINGQIYCPTLDLNGTQKK